MAASRNYFQALAIVALAALPPRELPAQETRVQQPVRIGDRVRLAVPTLLAKRVVGTVEALGPDTLVVKSERGREIVAVPLRSLTQLERSSGRGMDYKRGALYGAIAGAAASVVACLAKDWDCFASGPERPGLPLYLLTYLPAFSFGGMVAGGLIGYPYEDWVTVPLDGLGRSGSLPRQLTLCVNLSWRF